MFNFLSKKKDIDDSKAINQQKIDEYNKKYTVPYDSIELSEERNMILADRIFKSFAKDDTHPNNNVCVFGTGGSSKQMYYTTPNVYQRYGSYIVYETLPDFYYPSFKRVLENSGYNTILINFMEFDESNCYNPLDFLDNNIIDITEFSKSLLCPLYNEDFFLEDPLTVYETKLLSLAIYELLNNDLYSKQLSEIYNVLNSKEFIRKIEQLQFKEDAIGLAKETKQILNSKPKLIRELLETLTFLTDNRFQHITSKSDFDLNDLRKGKTFLFLTPGGGFIKQRSFFSVMLYQIYNIEKTNDSLPIRFYTGNIEDMPQIYNLSNLIKRNHTLINTNIMTRGVEFLKKQYKRTWEDVLDNCDTKIFLSGNFNEETGSYIEKEFKNKWIVPTNNCEKCRTHNIIQNNNIAYSCAYVNIMDKYYMVGNLIYDEEKYKIRN